VKPRVLIVCNALDEGTRHQRGITTDSPAASRKIFMLCQSLRLVGVRPCVVSLGRGAAGGSRQYFRAVLRRVDRVPVYYLPFSKIPLLSELITLLAPLGIVFQLWRRNYSSVVFYNRMPAYIAALLMSSLLGFRAILDLEDGELITGRSGLAASFGRLVCRLFDRLCRGGALLACSALATMTTARPVLSYYGVAPGGSVTRNPESEHVTVLMGGTLCRETGSDLVIETIRQLRQSGSAWAQRLRFEVTGKGSGMADFQRLAQEPGYPEVIVHGRTTDLQYREVLERSDVGLALKLNTGALANSTFPSKVIEFAAAGLLVLTTDISDVRMVLGETGALYLTRDEPRMLLGLFESIVRDRMKAHACAQRGTQNVQLLCAPRASGQRVADFIFGPEREK